MRLLTVLLLHCWEMYVCVWGARCGVCVCVLRITYIWYSVAVRHSCWLLCLGESKVLSECESSRKARSIWRESEFFLHLLDTTRQACAWSACWAHLPPPLWVCVWSKRLHKYSLVVQCFSVASPWVLLLGCSSPALWCFLVAPAPGTADSWAGVRRSAVPTEDQLPTMDNTLCALCACAVRCV